MKIGGFTPIKQPKTAFLLSAPVNIQALRFAHAEAEINKNARYID